MKTLILLVIVLSLFSVKLACAACFGLLVAFFCGLLKVNITYTVDDKKE